MDDAASADPAHPLEKRKLVGIPNGLPIDGRDDVTWKQTGAFSGTSGREPLHVHPTVRVRSRRRMIKKAEPEPAGTAGGRSARDESENQQRCIHFAGSSPRNEGKSMIVSVPGSSVR